MSEERKLQLQHLFDTRKLQIDIQRELRKSIDQAILTLSGAALGLSLTVIKDVVKASPSAEYMLVASWCCLLGASGHSPSTRQNPLRGHE